MKRLILGMMVGLIAVGSMLGCSSGDGGSQGGDDGSGGSAQGGGADQHWNKTSSPSDERDCKAAGAPVPAVRTCSVFEDIYKACPLPPSVTQPDFEGTTVY